VLPVADSETIAAMRMIFERMKLVVEPSSAIALAAVLKHREHLAGRRVGVILSGGNVDIDALPW
jgi:threonine dehydratase